MLMINNVNTSNRSAKLLNYTVLHIYIMYINIQDIENMVITFNTIKRYLDSIIYSDRFIR